jgi:hypothetical protein
MKKVDQNNQIKIYWNQSHAECAVSTGGSNMALNKAHKKVLRELVMQSWALFNTNLRKSLSEKVCSSQIAKIVAGTERSPPRH